MLDSITNLAKKIFGDSNARELKKLDPLVARVNELESKWEALSEAELKGMTAQFRTRLDNGEKLDDLLPEAFATVREASKRTMGMRHYDCQLVGGMVLHSGKIAEMKTGEGKTLVATLPSYLNALSGDGVHVITVNDYLAARDAEWMGTIYRYLGMTVGTILSGERNDTAKREAYGSDITYGTNNEFGFDYLRDNMKFDLARYVQRKHNYAIIDEVDSILIDEARTPLIISGPTNIPVDRYYVIDGVIPTLQSEVDYVVDEKAKSCTLTDDGINKVEERLGVDNLYDEQNMEILHHVNQALKAHHIFKRDRDYVVRDGKVVIVDEFTGRLMAGRRWSDGLHQAVEAKEKCQIQAESRTYANITFQNYFRMYEKLSGMTGTAVTEAAEFANIYDLDTLVIPTNKQVVRDDQDDIVYRTQMEKFRAVADDIREANAKGQPVLVGTTSVEKSELVGRLLGQMGIQHNVLNAKQHTREAHTVAQAGRAGSVTISTNMAGRGTDIKLGGNAEELARDECDPEVDPDGFEAALARWKELCTREEQEVRAAGGLRIIGTERHESRRVDNQLRGRAGRQGDVGSSKFYLSLEDDLLRIFGTDKMMVWMEKMGIEDDEPIEHRWITRAIENAQKKVEGYHFGVRKNLLEYDDVMNHQRQSVYDLRKKALKGDGVFEMVIESVENLVEDIMDETCMEGVHPEQWDPPGMRDRLDRIFGLTWTDADAEIRDHSRDELKQRMLEEATRLIERKADDMGRDVFDQIARMLLLQITDELWTEHLSAMERLRQGVSLRGYGQRNPLLEYKKEGFHMFLMMSALRDEQVVAKLLRAEVGLEAAASSAGKATARRIASGSLEGGAQGPAQPGPGLAIGAGAVSAAQRQAAESLMGGESEGAPQPLPPLELPPMEPEPVVERPAQGEEARLFAEKYGLRRNDPCPCGSGLKYKKCCAKA